MEADVVILGAGPAGAAAGLTLAPRHRVVLLDRLSQPVPRIGESLIPAARRVLRDMQILDAFEAEGHAPYLGNRSLWGGVESEVDFLRDPDGSGWHLDRARFESFLRNAAQQRGARVLSPAHLLTVERVDGQWQLGIDDGGKRHQLTAKLLIDAGGRHAPLAQRLGASSMATDRLVACWLRGTADRGDSATAGFSLVESEPDGWWYAAPVPDAAGCPAWVLAFHTDHDLMDSWLRDSESLLDRARRLPKIGEVLSRVGFQSQDGLHTTAANSAHLSPVVGPGWLAIGDAALSFDPLASRGIFNALYTAMTAAMFCHDALQNGDDFTNYAADIRRVHAAYAQQLVVHYAAETRWPDRPFWQRRMVAE